MGTVYLYPFLITNIKTLRDHRPYYALEMKFRCLVVALAAFVVGTNACNANGPRFDGDISKILGPRCSSKTCPSGSYKYHHGENGPTCCCYDGCCFDRCLTQIPPEGKCLAGTKSSRWIYDYKNKYWVLLKGPQEWKVPKPPATGCPSSTHYWSPHHNTRGTCCCDHGCCWDHCGAADPNNYGDCLKGTGAEWVRNNAK